MRRFVIENINPNREGYYYDTRHPPVSLTDEHRVTWLKGDYVISSLSTTNNVYDAMHYQTEKSAESAKTRLIDRYAYNGKHFTIHGFRYPDNLGNQKQYLNAQPIYLVVKIDVSIEIIK